VLAVDRSMPCINYIKDTARQHKLTQVKTFKADVLKYLQLETEQYDFIFADPPYDLNQIPGAAKNYFEKKLLFARRYAGCGTPELAKFKQPSRFF